MPKGIVRTLRATRAKVEKILLEPEKGSIYRDNDEKLAARFWADEVRGKGGNLKVMTAQDFLLKYAEGELTPIDLVLRARRKAQELNHDCRGVRWYERHGKGDDVAENKDQI